MKTKVTEVAATSQTSHQLHADPATTRSVRVFSSRPDVSSTFVVIVVVVRPPSPPSLLRLRGLLRCVGRSSSPPCRASVEELIDVAALA